MPILQTSSASHRRRVILGAVCWIAGLEFFLAEAIAVVGWPGYSRLALDVSYLGATSCAPFTDPDTAAVFDLCSPRHAAMNFGFVLLGVLHLAGLVLTYTAWPRHWLATVGLAALGMGAVGAVFVGLAPVDRDYSLHAAGAGLGLVVGNMGVALLGLAMLRRAPAFGLFSLVLGAAALAGFGLYIGHIYLGLGRGGMERVAAYPQTIWYALTGVSVLVGVLRSGTPPRSTPR